jgi:hypothetical protein
METILCDQCGGNGLVPVPGNAPSGTGRCPVCHGLGQITRPTERAGKQQDRDDAMQEPPDGDSLPHEAE